jgi:hypothetical protein
MIAGLFALALATGNVAIVPNDALITAFDRFCLAGKQPMEGLGAAALAAGYRQATLKAPQPRSHETAAWEADGIRLFALAAQVRDDLPPMPVCGVEADVGALETGDGPLLWPLRQRASSFATGHQDEDGSTYWSMAYSEGAWLHLATDRSRPDHVVAAIFVEVPKAVP